MPPMPLFFNDSKPLGAHSSYLSATDNTRRAPQTRLPAPAPWRSSLYGTSRSDKAETVRSRRRVVVAGVPAKASVFELSSHHRCVPLAGADGIRQSAERAGAVHRWRRDVRVAANALGNQERAPSLATRIRFHVAVKRSLPISRSRRWRHQRRTRSCQNEPRGTHRGLKYTPVGTGENTRGCIRVSDRRA